MADRIFTKLDALIVATTKRKNEYLQELNRNPPPWSGVQKVMFQARIQELQDDYVLGNSSIEKLEAKATVMKTDDPAKQILFDRIDSWIEQHQDLKDQIKRIILEGNGYLKLTPQINDEGNISINSDATQTDSVVTVTVPPINLPKFNGDYCKWNSFWQRFERLVHQRDYPKVEKLVALMSLLEGKAMRAVEGFQLADENYDTVIEILSSRFGNKQMIIKELQVKLRTIQQAKPNAESMRYTVDAINNMCRQLKNYGVDIENDSLRLDIIDKMPAVEKDKLTYLMVTSPGTTTEAILQKIESLILKAEIVSQNQQKFQNTLPNMNKNILSNFKKDDSSITQQHGFYQNNSKSGPNFKPTVTAGKIKCSLCDDNHYSSKCPKYFTADDKLKQLRSRNFCTKCLRGNHDTNSCFSKIVCNLCQGNHHTCLCKTKTVPTKSSAFVTVGKKQGALITKAVSIVNPVTKESTETVVLFDSGSQQSYISNKVIEQLKLETIEEEKVNIIGFGGKSSSYNSYLVKYGIQTNHGYKELYANSTKYITSTVPVTEAVESTNNLKTDYKTPGILIGMDYFFDIINSFEKRDDNLLIINSNIGKIICKKTPKQNKVTVTSLANTSPYFDKKENYLQDTNNTEMNGVQNSSNNKKPQRKSGIQNCINALDEKEGKFYSKNGKESIKSETAVIVVIDNNEESEKVQEFQLCGKVKEKKLYDDGLTTDSDVIFDYPMCQPWKPWTSNKIIDQLKLENVQQERDQSDNKLQRQQKYIRPPFSVTKVKDATSGTSKGCGGEHLVKNYKKPNKLLNSKNNNGLKEIVVQYETDEHNNGFITKREIKHLYPTEEDMKVNESVSDSDNNIQNGNNINSHFKQQKNWQRSDST